MLGRVVLWLLGRLKLEFGSGDVNFGRVGVLIWLIWGVGLAQLDGVVKIELELAS